MLVATFPDAEVGRAVGACQVVHQVLNKGEFVSLPHDGQARHAHARQHEHEERRRVDLQVAPVGIAHHRLAGAGVVLGVQRIERILRVLETLDLGRLAHHRRQQAAHQAQHAVVQRGCANRVDVAVGQSQCPHGKNAVDVVAHPGMGVVAVHRDGSAGRQQAGGEVLARHNDCLRLGRELVEALPARCGGKVRAGRVVDVHDGILRVVNCPLLAAVQVRCDPAARRLSSLDVAQRATSRPEGPRHGARRQSSYFDVCGHVRDRNECFE